MIHSVVAVFILAGQCLHERTACQCSRQDFYDSSEAVALVAAGFFAQTAQRQQSNVACTHFLQDGSGLGHSAAVLSNYQTCRSILALSSIELNLTVLDDTGCAVKVEREFLIGRHSKGQRVGAHHRLNAEGRSYGRSCVGTGNTDHACLFSHSGPVACNAIVSRIKDGAAGHTVLGSLFNQHFHHLMGSNHAHAIVSIHNYSTRSILDNFNFGFRQQGAVFNTIQVNRLEAVAAVALDTASVAFQQNICTNACILFGNAVFNKYVYHKIVD